MSATQKPSTKPPLSKASVDQLLDVVDEPVAFLYSQLNALLTENTKQLNEAKKKLQQSVPLSQYQELQSQLQVCIHFICLFIVPPPSPPNLKTSNWKKN